MSKFENIANWKLAVGIWVVCLAVFASVAGKRLNAPTPNNHYVHLANSFLSFRLDHDGNPPGTNDWACFDTVEQDACPPGRYRFQNAERFRWFVSFPPFPAVVIAPAVAIWKTSTRDALFWILIAALGPALLFLTLERLREEELNPRTKSTNFALALLFALGTVFFFAAVQGTVWFSAQVVATSLLILYLRWGSGARKPLLAGLMLGLAFMTRPTTALLCVFFGVELMRVHSKGDGLLNVDWKTAIKKGLIFSAPILVIGGIAMWMNQSRFGDPFEFGHTYLQIAWRDRIETWGLFNYHFFPKNLAIFLTSMPWLSVEAPHVMVSRHGLALWFTSPFLLTLLWPKEKPAFLYSLWFAIIPVMIMNLSYQNSGWIQFGYRFALDYMPLLFVALAVQNRRLGKLFWIAGIFAIGVNLFGAVTFDRLHQFYDNDRTQNVIFQPD